MSRLKSVRQFCLSDLRGKNYRFQPCVFLKFRKISEITSVVKILFQRADARRFALQNTCSKQFRGKPPRRSASAVKKYSTSYVSKSCWKVSKKKIGAASENSKIFYKIFMPMPRLSDGSFFTLMKSCYSKRYIKIHGPPPCQMPYFFT